MLQTDTLSSQEELLERALRPKTLQDYGANIKPANSCTFSYRPLNCVVKP